MSCVRITYYAHTGALSSLTAARMNEHHLAIIHHLAIMHTPGWGDPVPCQRKAWKPSHPPLWSGSRSCFIVQLSCRGQPERGNTAGQPASSIAFTALTTYAYPTAFTTLISFRSSHKPSQLSQFRSALAVVWNAYPMASEEADWRTTTASIYLVCVCVSALGCRANTRTNSSGLQCISNSFLKLIG